MCYYRGAITKIRQEGYKNTMGNKRYSISIDENTAREIEMISKKSGESIAEVTRSLIKKGLSSGWVDENVDMITHIVRQQLEAVMKPHVERLAKLSVKSGIMSATSTFLNVQAFQDLVPKEKRKIPVELYDKARKKAAEYMKTPASEFDMEGG